MKQTEPKTVKIGIVNRVWIVIACLIALSGCDTGTTLKGQISGVIYDANGAVVRNARVWVSTGGKQETRSNSSGAFVLQNVKEGDLFVEAEITVGGIRFIGQNVARVFGGERTRSVNIGVYRQNQLAGLEGTVRDRFGNVIQGARVFAAAANSLSGAMAITDDRGYFSLGRLLGGVMYQLNAGGRGYDSDTDTVTLTSGTVLPFDFVLREGTNPLLPAPQNLTAVAWTSPYESTRSAKGNAAENIKRLYDPRTFAKRKATSRVTSGGNNIEVDLFWDPVNSQSLLGYGIYRARTSNGASTGIDFLRDPLTSFFQDLDQDLTETNNYYYEITALSVQYPDTSNSESDFSNRYGVQTLGDMDLRPVTQSPVRFRWYSAPGAEGYIVFLFDQYPSLGVDSIWDNSSAQATGTELVYNGPTLQSGHRYYYVVLGLANSNDSRTISVVGDFVKN